MRRTLLSLTTSAFLLASVARVTALRPIAWPNLRMIELADALARQALDAQLKLINSDVLAGVIYPAAVHDLEYHQIDVFVNTLLRRLIGCASGSSATFLRCELGLLPSKFL